MYIKQFREKRYVKPFWELSDAEFCDYWSKIAAKRYKAKKMGRVEVYQEVFCHLLQLCKKGQRLTDGHHKPATYWWTVIQHCVRKIYQRNTKDGMRDKRWCHFIFFSAIEDFKIDDYVPSYTQDFEIDELPPIKLTPLRQKVLNLLLQGHTYQQVMEKLGIKKKHFEDIIYLIRKAFKKYWSKQPA